MKITRVQFFKELYPWRALTEILLTIAYVVVRVLEIVGRPFRFVTSYGSDDFRSFLSRLFTVLGYFALVASGAYLHSRWQDGEDIVPSLVAVTVISLVTIFTRRRSNKPVEPTSHSAPRCDPRLT